MEYNSQAKIISYNLDSSAVCASAARISTTIGSANKIFEDSKTNSNNDQLIKKVLRSGHRSIIEHAFFTIALCNVSAFVEQFFIEFRLASFTVKSRRYVDFSDQGYYIPEDLTGEDLRFYCEYMDMLFDAYQKLLELDIPKEDARFLLPYSFNSNFYCTINARELINLLQAVKKGRGRTITELQHLADQIIKQIAGIFPCIIDELDCADESTHTPDRSNIAINKNPVFLTEDRVGNVRLINCPNDPKLIFETAYKITDPFPKDPINYKQIINSDRPRCLEQLTYSFLISDITLSGITHIVRHRMQSVIIPSIKSIDHFKYIIPRTILENPDAEKLYRRTLIHAGEMLCSVKESGRLSQYLYYFAVSGNVMDIMTTLNARELLLFIRLRTCSRAQWEVKDIALNMLRHLRNHFPELFNAYGPSCFIRGECPEGRMSCGKMKEVVKKFKAEQSKN